VSRRGKLAVSVDGFFAGPHGEIDWFKAISRDEEYERFTHQQSKSESTLMFGRTTYEMMKSYWPTPDAIKNDPQMAAVMNNSPKIVFSKTLKTVEEGPNWENVTLVRQIRRDAILEWKRKSDITILGSGSIVQQLANLGLIDEYQLVVVPLVLGSGKRLFQDVKKIDLHLQDSRAFANGIVVVKYTSAGG
jgi:dihydrofolate reductase